MMKIKEALQESFRKWRAWQKPTPIEMNGCKKLSVILNWFWLVMLAIGTVFLIYLNIDARRDVPNNNVEIAREQQCLEELEILKDQTHDFEERKALVMAILQVPVRKRNDVKGEKSSYCGLLNQMKSYSHGHHIH